MSVVSKTAMAEPALIGSNDRVNSFPVSSYVPVIPYELVNNASILSSTRSFVKYKFEPSVKLAVV